MRAVLAQVKNILSSNLWILLHEDMMFESATAIHASRKDSLRTKAKPQRVAESKMERTVGT